jgi:hypothetical protein
MATRIDPADADLEPKALAADPRGHAEILVGILGFEVAIEMAHLYARQWPADAYWARVLSALKERSGA